MRAFDATDKSLTPFPNLVVLKMDRLHAAQNDMGSITGDRLKSGPMARPAKRFRPASTTYQNVVCYAVSGKSILAHGSRDRIELRWWVQKWSVDSYPK